MMKLLILTAIFAASACAGPPFTAFNEGTPDANQSGDAGAAGEESQESGGSSGSAGSFASQGGTGGIPDNVGRAGSFASQAGQQATGGLPNEVAGSGGVPSSGGSPATAGTGTAGSPESNTQCLSGYDKRECGDFCNKAAPAYRECVQVLNCMIEKNVKLPQGSLDPCYPSEYVALSIAIRVYDACCLGENQ